ncbi:hypothetical protein Sango_0783300 [Sesamum angolense]|uniref:Uncharacterized protein n=1 Tax=Sesamum angolense TaxID=2727404 RepID=A0AAE2C048_9LAMI|nr:hypothetical protein Sango_0783300 [Sesamum angolense]
MDKPRSILLNVALRILKYLKSSLVRGYYSKHGHIKIETSIADYVGCKDDRKSTSSHCTYVRGIMQLGTTRNRQERLDAMVQYRAMAHIASEVLWLKNLLRELDSHTMTL